MDFRMQILGSLGGLDTTHLAQKCYDSARLLIEATTVPADAPAYLHDILSKTNIGTCSRLARKYRYRLAVAVLVADDNGPTLQLLQLACKYTLDCLVFEQQPADSEEFGALCTTLSASLTAYQALPARGIEDPGSQSSKVPPAVCTVLIEPLINSIARSATQETAACGHLALEGALGALAQSSGNVCNFNNVLAWALRSLLHGMNSGSLRMALVYQAHRPLRQCLMPLGLSITPSAVRGCVRSCLQGACHQESWNFRVEALLTLEALCEALQVPKGSRSSSHGDSGLAALLDALPGLLPHIQPLRYDKIAQVRSAYHRALRPLAVLTADDDRIDLSQTVAPAVAAPSHSASASAASPTAAKRRHTFIASRSLNRAAHGNSCDDERPFTAAGRPTRHAPSAGPLDFGIRVFAPTTPPPRPIPLTQPDTSQDAKEAPEEHPLQLAKPPVAQHVQQPNQVLSDPPQPQQQTQQPDQQQQQAQHSEQQEQQTERSEQQQHLSTLPSDQQKGEQCSRPHLPSSPPSLPQQTTASLTSPQHRRQAHWSESPRSRLVREASVQTPSNGLPAHRGNTHVLAGPVSINVDANHKSFNMSGCRLRGEVESIQCWMNSAAPQDFGFEVCVPSHRPGISTTYRVVCKGGLMHQETTEGPTAGSAPTSHPHHHPTHSSPSSASSSPTHTPADFKYEGGEAPAITAHSDSVLSTAAAADLSEGVCSPAPAPVPAPALAPTPAAAAPLRPQQPRKSLAWEVLL